MVGNEVVVDFYLFVISPSQDTLSSELIFIKYERLILFLSRGICNFRSKFHRLRRLVFFFKQIRFD